MSDGKYTYAFSGQNKVNNNEYTYHLTAIVRTGPSYNNSTDL